MIPRPALARANLLASRRIATRRLPQARFQSTGPTPVAGPSASSHLAAGVAGGATVALIGKLTLSIPLKKRLIESPQATHITTPQASKRPSKHPTTSNHTSKKQKTASSPKPKKQPRTHPKRSNTSATSPNPTLHSSPAHRGTSIRPLTSSMRSARSMVRIWIRS